MNGMKCPYCGQDMVKGVFLEARGMGVTYWLPEDYMRQHAFPPATLKAIERAGGFKLRCGFGLTASPDALYVCKPCGKIVGDVPGTRSENQEVDV